MSKEQTPRYGSRIILFSDDTEWRNAEDRPVLDYARDLHAAVTRVGAEVSWYTIPYPRRRRDVQGWVLGLIKSSWSLNELQRLRWYPNTLSARALNNLAILLNCGSEYFFLRAPSNIDGERESVMAVSVDTNRTACLIDLEAPVPRFLDPTYVRGAVAVAEGI
jgi:hypothetical protein